MKEQIVPEKNLGPGRASLKPFEKAKNEESTATASAMNSQKK